MGGEVSVDGEAPPRRPDPAVLGPGALDALESLYRSDYAASVRLARLLVGDGHRAEELAQEAFVRVAGRIDALDNPGGYLRTVLVNLCHDHGRRLRTVRRHPDPRPEEMAPPDLPSDLSEIWRAVQSLPQRQRDALVLRYWADLSTEEVGRLLGVRPGSVRSLVHRGLASLQEVLSDAR